MQSTGNYCKKLATELFPICRSIMGPGTRQTLKILNREMPDLEIKQVKSGYKAFDWTVPKEWQIKEAYIEDSQGNRIVDFEENNLHVINYSQAVDTFLSLSELKENLHSIPSMPEAIPYLASYYDKTWGFCIADNIKSQLKDDTYHCVINSNFIDGTLDYGELLIKGESSKEIFLSTYICHPSMGNNELSGPVLATALGKWLKSSPRKFSYRIIFIPETIGSIVYLSKNLKLLKEKVFAGFNISCVGDNRAYSFLPSRNGNTIADKAAKHALKQKCKNFIEYTWLDRGSDERQYCSPGVDLPVASIMRSKYGTFPEYHTSLDNLDLITEDGFSGSFEVISNAIMILEENLIPVSNFLCEPQLGKRNLYHKLTPREKPQTATMMDLISFSDGKKSLLEIAEETGQNFIELKKIYDILKNQNILYSKRA